MDSDGTFLKSKQIDEVKKNLKTNKFSFVNIDNPAKLKVDDTWIDKHIGYVMKLNYINTAKIKRRKFKVVVDAVNASGSVIIPRLLKKLGCQVVELYCNGSGKFPHLPEPLPHNLKLLSAGVRKHKADIGLAIDPDGDRLVLICEDGKPFIEENTIVTVVRNVLKHSNKKNIVCVNMSTTRAVEDVANDYKGKVHRTPVGEINVVNEMKKVKAIVGGEGSGGVIVPKVHYGRDASVGVALVLNELADFKGKVSEYKNSIPQYHIEKAKIETKGDPSSLLIRIEKEYRKKDCKVSTIDGVKLDFADYWIHLRKSNTEPIIRIITEAKSKKEAVRIQTDFLKGLKY